MPSRPKQPETSEADSRRRTARAAASMPVLRRPHDHHRDLRARLRAEAPPHTGSGGDQDRHLMMPSLPIDDRHPARQSCRLSTGSAHACRWPPDCPAIAPPISARDSTLRSFTPPTTSVQLQAKPSQQPLRSHILRPDPAAKSHSARGTPARQHDLAPRPPIRALALSTGRRRAWKPRHCRRPKTCKEADSCAAAETAWLSITSSARASRSVRRI